MREWNNDEPRPATLALLIHKLKAHHEAMMTVMREEKGWKNDTRIHVHIAQAKETLETAREDGKELYGTEGSVLNERVKKWETRLWQLQEQLVY